jgi:hypothetical protein
MHLNNLIEDLIKKGIPEIVIKNRTFFDISKMPHRETVISNWYLYFFNSLEEHKQGNLFLQSLLNIYNKKNNSNFELNEFFVQTEVFTKKGNRIDIVISGRGNDHNKFIIIENKIYHSLNNDLNDYWNNFNCETDKKIGIVLSLKKIKINQNNAKFINILHTELLNEVRSYIDLTSLNQKQEFYFENFSDALNNLSKDLNMNTQAKFYFENCLAVNKIAESKVEAKKYIQTQLEIVAENIGCKRDDNGGEYNWLLIPNCNNVYYTIVFDELFEGQKLIGIIIELSGNALKKMSLLDNVLVGKINAKNLDHKSTVHKYFAHYISKSYQLSSIETLSEFVTERINTDFKPLTEEIIKLLNKN